jgi:hypothetical protein
MLYTLGYPTIPESEEAFVEAFRRAYSGKFVIGHDLDVSERRTAPRRSNLTAGVCQQK